jgi:pimeloyl-ACP methyl ester carboxylesterase
VTASIDVNRRQVTAADGTPIGCLRVGRGPGLVLLHGAMQTAGSQLELAQSLADTWRVTLPDRRGRGASGPRRPHEEQAHRDTDTGADTDVEDVAAVVAATGAETVIGVSSGAILALQTARAVPAVRRLVVFEPPILNDAQHARQNLSRVECELGEGRVDAALTTGWLAVQLGPAFLRRLPRPVLERLVHLGSRAEARRAADPATTMLALAPTLQHDFFLVAAVSGQRGQFADVTVPTLLLGGERSPAYLKAALDELQAVLPHCQRVTLPGVGHEATGNRAQRGRPELVAAAVRDFLTH